MKSIVAILKATTEVTSLLANGANSVYSDIAEQGHDQPYVIVDTAESTGNPTKSGVSITDEHQVRVFAVAKRKYTNGSEAGSVDVAKEIRNKLDYHTGTYAGEVIKDIHWEAQDSYYAGTANKKMYETMQEYRVWEHRNLI